MSRDARACPKCNTPNAARRDVRVTTVVKGAVVIIALLLIYNLIVWLRRP